MSQSDSDFIEEEDRQEEIRKQAIHHVLMQQRVAASALGDLLVLPNELLMMANIFDDYAAQLRAQAEKLKSI